MSVRECQRCKGVTKQGRRCTRTTCLYAKYCFQHAQKTKALAVKQSTIAGAGKGLFAATDLPRGTSLPYKGELMTQRELDQRYGRDELAEYVVGYGRGRNIRYVDARSTQSCLARYANDVHGTNLRPNAVFRDPPRGQRWPLLVLTRAVRRGEEILTRYLGRYWEN